LVWFVGPKLAEEHPTLEPTKIRVKVMDIISVNDFFTPVYKKFSKKSVFQNEFSVGYAHFFKFISTKVLIG